jgi:hypothetical protein
MVVTIFCFYVITTIAQYPDTILAGHVLWICQRADARITDGVTVSVIYKPRVKRGDQRRTDLVNVVTKLQQRQQT